jgi:hypothetical protein
MQIFCLLIFSVAGISQIPHPPQNLTLANRTTTALLLLWEDSSHNETGFRVERSLSGDSSTFALVAETDSNSTSLIDFGLQISRRYYYRVRSFNSNGESEPVFVSGATLAETPGTPVVQKTSWHYLEMKILYNGNPDATEFAMEVENNDTILFVQENGELGNEKQWLSDFPSAVVTVSNLHYAQEYSFRMQARNPEHLETEYSMSILLSTLSPMEIDINPLFEQFGIPPQQLATFPPDGWKVLDADNDGVTGVYGTWHYSTTNTFSAGGSARYFSQTFPCEFPCDSLPGNDFLFTPPLKLVSSVRYTISFYYRTLADNPHLLSLYLTSSQSQGTIVDTISDEAYETNGGYYLKYVTFFPQTSGVYYLGFYVHSPTNRVTIRIEDVRIELSPLYDLAMESFIQENRFPEYYQGNGKTIFKKKNLYADDDETQQRIVRTTVSKTKPRGKKTSTHPVFVENAVQKISPINIHFKSFPHSILRNDIQDAISQSAVHNIGQNNVLGSYWDVEWKTASLFQQSIPGTFLSAGNTNTVTLSFAPPNIGTYYSYANITMLGDGNPMNDSAKQWLFAYPEHLFVLDYDSGGNTPSFRNGSDEGISTTAAVRFTIPDGKFLKLVGVNTFYTTNTTETHPPGTLDFKVFVYGASVDSSGNTDTTTVGPLLYSKIISELDWNYNYKHVGYGQNFTIPLDEANFSFLPGTHFFIAVSFPAEIANPLGMESVDATPNLVRGRSFLSEDNGQTWAMLFEGFAAWQIKALFEPLNSINVNQFADNDGDTLTTDDRIPLEHWLVSLYDSSGNFIDSLRTESDGDAFFSSLEYHLQPGTYRVVGETRNGFLNINSSVANLSVFGNNGNADFLHFQYGTISGFVYHDINANGTRDTVEGHLEPPLAQWNVRLKSNGIVIDSAASDAFGYYEFHELGPAQYIVEEVIKEGWIRTEPVSPGSYMLGMTSGAIFSDKNFGNRLQTNVLEKEVPKENFLAQNYPNPFNPLTVIRYSLIVNSVVTLNVYDLLGREIATLLNNEKKEAGKYEVEFEATNVPSGIYFYRLSITQLGKLCYNETKKFVVVK